MKLNIFQLISLKHLSQAIAFCVICFNGYSQHLPPGVTAKSFNGTSDYVKYPDKTEYHLGANSFSIEVLFKYNSQGGSYQTLVSYETTCGSYLGYDLYVYSNGVSFFCADNVSAAQISTNTITLTDGGWYHLVLVKNGLLRANWKIYINAVSQQLAHSYGDLSNGSINNCPANTFSGIHAGTRVIGSGTPAEYFTGEIAKVGVYNRELTSGEVTSLYSNNNPLNTEVSGAVLLDKLVTGNNVGTGTGSSQWITTSTNNIYYDAGAVGIGTGAIQLGGTEYKLFVRKGIRTEKLKVDVPNSIWPDYVFDKDYKLLTPEEIEKFIKLNHHLPGIPSAKEVEKNGIDVGMTQVLLLKKIEELTLIIIEQNKEQQSLKKIISEQNSKIGRIQKTLKNPVKK